MHTIPIQLRFNDIDLMGHVNNAVIMEFFDLGKSRFFAESGVPVTPEEGDFCVMVVHFELDFHKQIHFHDQVSVTTQITHWGNKSLEVTQQVLVDDQPAATCKTVMAGYSREAHSSAAIPEAVKERVRHYEQSH